MPDLPDEPAGLVEEQADNSVSVERARTVAGKNGGTLTPWVKGKSGNPLGRPPKSKAEHMALAALTGLGMRAAKNIEACMDSQNEKIRLQASQFVISLLHKAGKLEREISDEELANLDAHISKLDEQQIREALASLAPESK